jgi:hypothetical protein
VACTVSTLATLASAFRSPPSLHSQLSALFELQVDTYGTRAYAKRIVGLLDPTGRLFGERIVSRCDSRLRHKESASWIHRSLRDDSMVLIVDDTEAMWPGARNLVVIEPYSYWRSEAAEVNNAAGRSVVSTAPGGGPVAVMPPAGSGAGAGRPVPSLKPTGTAPTAGPAANAGKLAATGDASEGTGPRAGVQDAAAASASVSPDSSAASSAAAAASSSPALAPFSAAAAAAVDEYDPLSPVNTEGNTIPFAGEEDGEEENGSEAAAGAGDVVIEAGATAAATSPSTEVPAAAPRSAQGAARASLSGLMTNNTASASSTASASAPGSLEGVPAGSVGQKRSRAEMEVGATVGAAAVVTLAPLAAAAASVAASAALAAAPEADLSRWCLEPPHDYLQDVETLLRRVHATYYDRWDAVSGGSSRDDTAVNGSSSAPAPQPVAASSSAHMDVDASTDAATQSNGAGDLLEAASAGEGRSGELATVGDGQSSAGEPSSTGVITAAASSSAAPESALGLSLKGLASGSAVGVCGSPPLAGGPPPHTSDILQECIREVLLGVALVFSGVFPLEINAAKTPLHRRCLLFGAHIGESLTPAGLTSTPEAREALARAAMVDGVLSRGSSLAASETYKSRSSGSDSRPPPRIAECLTHLVARVPGTQKIHDAMARPGLRIVHLAWLEECLKRYARQPEERYPVEAGLAAYTRGGTAAQARIAALQRLAVTQRRLEQSLAVPRTPQAAVGLVISATESLVAPIARPIASGAQPLGGIPGPAAGPLPAKPRDVPACAAAPPATAKADSSAAAAESGGAAVSDTAPGDDDSGTSSDGSSLLHDSDWGDDA